LGIIKRETMPSLRSMLHEYDLDFLSRIARSWDAAVSQKDQETALSDLLLLMNQEKAFLDLLSNLTNNSRRALDALMQRGGSIPVESFSRNFGEIRALGPAKRAREAPDLHPVSVTEQLWYSGLVGKAFLSYQNEVREVIFIPDELIIFLRGAGCAKVPLKIRPAVTQSPRFIVPASLSLLDHVTDLLASYRMGREIDPDLFDQWNVPRKFLLPLLQTSGVLDKKRQPNQEKLKDFLQAGRAAALVSLYQAWLGSTDVNDLRLLPGFVFDGKWVNDPLPPRQLLVGILLSLSNETWYSISSLLTEVKEKQPDFQRFAGEYESWFIRKEDEQPYLKGFEHWDDVEGALLRYLLCSPLHWFGILDLARGSAEGDPAAFRLTGIGRYLLTGETSPALNNETGVVEVKQADTYGIQDNTPLQLRYQAARFGKLIRYANHFSWYRLTPDSLSVAASQGLNLHQLILLLEKSQPKPVPRSLQRLAERWEAHHLEASIKTALLLRFVSADACSLFLANPRSGPMVLEQLNPLTLLLHPNSQEAAHRLLAELGILAETEAVV
jgi:hypothetical protein